MKSSRDKQILLDQLRKTPIVQIACEKCGISRASFYRWRADPKFAQAADEAQSEGVALVNDMAESVLLSSIQDRMPWAVMYWLRNRSAPYMQRIKIDANVTHQTEELTPEQEELVARALALGRLLPANKFKKHNKEKKHEQR
jgi:hypothetical protein